MPNLRALVAAAALTHVACGGAADPGGDAPASYAWAEDAAEAQDVGPMAEPDATAAPQPDTGPTPTLDVTPDIEPDATPPTATAGWDDVDHPISTTALGHPVALVCHNCYTTGAGDPAANLAATLSALHQAQSAGADGLELDVKVEAGVLRVDHEDDGGTEGALLADVLADPELQAGTNLLFVELKETAPDAAAIGELLDLVRDHGLAGPGRPLLLRAFGDERREGLLLARDLLATAEHADLAPHVRLHELVPPFGGLAGPLVGEIVANALADGLHGLEVSGGNLDLVAVLRQTRAAGLTGGVWTIPDEDFELPLALLREVADVLVTDAPLDAARAVVEADDVLVHVDLWEDGEVELGVGAGLFGGASAWSALAGEALGDATVGPGEGALLAVVARLDGVFDLAPGVTWRLVGDDRLFLDLQRPLDGPGVLRFGVRVAGVTSTATLPVTDLDPARGHLIAGAWGGDGRVRLTVDYPAEGAPALVTGGLPEPTQPVAVGPGPPPEGLVQQVRVLRWPHVTPAPAAATPDDPDPSTWERLQIVVRTADDHEYANTDDGFEVCLSETWCQKLDVPSYDDYENGDINEHLFEAPGLGPSDVDRVVLQPAADASDAWRPDCIAIIADGVPLHCNDDLGIEWLGTDATDLQQFVDPAPFTLGCASCYPGGEPSHGPMVGHTTTRDAKLWLRTSASRAVQVRYGTDPTFASAALTPPVVPTHAEDFTTKPTLPGLSPDTVYHYEVLVDGDPTGAHTFRTAPAGPAAFEAMFGSCAKYSAYPEMVIYDAIAARSPGLMMMVGDNHYANSTDAQTLGAYYRRSRRVASFAGLLASTPTWATWDDHDYTGNNTDHSVAGKETSLVAFERYWANASYGGPEPGVWSRFSWGDVDFFLLDDRYYRDVAGGTMLGAAQLDWLLTELAASTATFKVLASGSQWTPGGSSDSWKVFPEERELILDTVMASGISGVILISGDVHRSEVRRLRDASDTTYEVWELTSSPLANTNFGCSTSTPPDTVLFCEATTRYYGLLRFDTTKDVPEVTYEIRDEADAIRYGVTVGLDQLTL